MFIPGINLLSPSSWSASAYAAYLLYLGSMIVMKVPQAKAAGYTAVVVVIWIVISIVRRRLIIGARHDGGRGGSDARGRR